MEELQEWGVQAKLHLLGDTRQMQAISAGDLLRQVRELGERGQVDYAHLTDTLRQKEFSLLDVARGLTGRTGRWGRTRGRSWGTSWRYRTGPD